MINGSFNGVQIYSNKNSGVNINGDVIRFGDGSWCNTRTGEVHNVGRGFIEINGARHEAGATSETRPVDKVTLPATLYDARMLQVGDISADVTVEIHDRAGISFEARGPQNEIEALQVGVDHAGMLRVTGQQHAGSGDISISSSSRGRGFSFGSIFSSRDIVMSGDFGSTRNETQIKVLVPRGTPVSLDSVNGQVTVGDTQAPLNVEASGTSDIRVGRISHAKLKLSGAGDIDVAAVRGHVEIRLSGAGDIKVREGEIGRLEIRCSGAGNVKVGATAQSAEIRSSGVGNVRVHRVLTEPLKRNSGAGKIRIEQVG